MGVFDKFLEKIESKDLKPNINLDRPNYVQPEDRISYRSFRLIIILGMLNNKYGLSKDVIACVDFLLRNESYQMKFIAEYYKGKRVITDKLIQYERKSDLEIDFNVVQYRSVPWDLRFNDMFMYLYTRSLILIKTDKNNKNLRIKLSNTGHEIFGMISDFFPSEINFLELFGTRLSEDKTIKIITEVIPNSYWKRNEEFID